MMYLNCNQFKKYVLQHFCTNAHMMHNNLPFLVCLCKFAFFPDFYPAESCEMPTPIRPHQRPLARDKYENFSRPAKAKLGKLFRVWMTRYILIQMKVRGGFRSCLQGKRYMLFAS